MDARTVIGTQSRHARRRLLGSLAATATVVLLVGACGDSGSTSGTPAAESGIDSATATRLDAAIESAMTQASIPGALVGIWGPGGEYVTAHGVADKSTRAPMRL